MDVDNSGCLDHEELKNALVALQIPLTDEEMKTLIKRLDLDGDGRVDYMEFIKFVHVGGEEGDGVLSTDRVEDALTHLSRAIFLYSDHNFFNMRAECYFRLHDLKSCISNLRYVLKLLPGDQDTRKKLARVLDLQGINWLKARNYKAGESCFSESCKLDPIASTFWVHKSIALVYAEDYSEALKAVEQAMSVEQVRRSEERRTAGAKRQQKLYTAFLHTNNPPLVATLLARFAHRRQLRTFTALREKYTGHST